MKRVNLLIFMAALVFGFTACQESLPELGTLPDKSEMFYEVVQDYVADEGGNTVVLRNLTPETVAMWDYGTGRSNKNIDTVRFAFKGQYTVKFSALTGAGIVECDDVVINVTEDNLMYVNDPLWTAISGGVGNEKTWYLDLNAASESRYFDGPLFFYGTDMTWGGVCKDGGSDCWNWNPVYKDNSWLMTAGDYGSMTFSLKGGPFVKVEHLMLPSRGTENGTYFLDVDNKTLTMTDAAPLHDSGRDGVVVNWGDIKLLSLTEDNMQIAVYRDPVLSGEGACYLVYNFVSKDYYDNWIPEDLPDPEPLLPDGWKDDVSQTVTTKIKWVLSDQTPFNWASLDGTLMNAWNKPSDYPSWTGFDATIPPTYADFSMTFESKDNTVEYVAPDGTTQSGTYTLDDKGIYTFTGVTPNFTICSWVTLHTTAENQWRITKIEKDAAGAITGMWVGAKDPVKDEYMVYKLVKSTGATVADPMAAWKTALVGKTFKPDVNWFIDWINFDQTGGWTSASTFGTDYTSNPWVWTEKTRAIAESASIKFVASGKYIKAIFTQDVYGADGVLVTAGYTAEGIVTIKDDVPSMKFTFPLVDYTGSPGNWLNKSNPLGVHYTTALEELEWLFVSHGESNLANIDTNGMWLGAVSNAIAGGNDKDELLVFHYVVSQ